MPMIDVYATEGTFADKHALAQNLAAAVMRWEQVPDLALFRDNTAAFVHDLPADSIANVAGESNYVRVQVLTPAGVLDRDKQLGVVKRADRDRGRGSRRSESGRSARGCCSRSRPTAAGESPATRTPALISPRPPGQNSRRTPSHRQEQHERPAESIEA